MHLQWRMKCSVLMQQTFILDFSFIVVWIHRNWRERYRELRCSSCPPHAQPPLLPLSPPEAAFPTADEPQGRLTVSLGAGIL